MTPAEVAHRARVALRDRVSPPAYARVAPAQAFALLFPGSPEEALRASRLDKLVHLPAGVGSLEFAVSAARELRAGRWSRFGRTVQLEDPPRWWRQHGGEGGWPDLPSGAIDHRHGGPAGGAQLAWELGRLTFLPTLALAARLTGQRGHPHQAA